MITAKRRRSNGEVEDDDDDDDRDGDGIDAWERAYTDERSWEALQEDESGLLRPIDNKAISHAQYCRRLRSLSATAARIQKGLIRFLFIVVDLSRAAAEMDFRPSRMAVIVKHVEAFVREFFDHNPLSQIGLVTIKDGIAHSLTELGGSPESHIKALMGKMEPSEMSICKHLCQETGGLYTVAMDEAHFKELMLEHTLAPPVIAEFAIANLIKMGFPQRVAESSISICSCHKEAKVGDGYICPRCKARVCELPTDCRICGLTLVSSPHLARSYHHLFPIVPFNELYPKQNVNHHRSPKTCFGCQQSLLTYGNKPSISVACPKCKQYFCVDCDIYIHESLHNCPGCDSSGQS